MRVSRRLEAMTPIDRETLLLLLTAKMAPIQPLGYTRVLGHDGLTLRSMAGQALHPNVTLLHASVGLSVEQRAVPAALLLVGLYPHGQTSPNRLLSRR
jgi:hypothetical protein